MKDFVTGTALDMAGIQGTAKIRTPVMILASPICMGSTLLPREVRHTFVAITGIAWQEPIPFLGFMVGIVLSAGLWFDIAAVVWIVAL